MKKVMIGGMLALLFFAGCNRAQVNESKTTTQSNQDMTFVIVPKVVHPWYDQINKGAQRMAQFLSEKLGCNITVDYRAPQTGDVVTQNAVLEQAAATRPDGIALAPLDYEGNGAVIDEIRNLGIPFIVFDAIAPEGSGMASIGSDFVLAGRITANTIAEIIGRRGKVAVMQGVPTAPNHRQRYESILETLRNYPDIKVIEGGIDNDSIEQSQAAAAATIAANPDLVGYVNVDGTGAGLATAIEEAGKVGQIHAVTQAGLADIYDAVERGIIDVTIPIRPQTQGAMIVMQLWLGASGQDMAETVDCGLDIVNKDNVADFIRLFNQ